ncbi:MAG: D-alanyl-D-alanine carboxypeptidase [Defluviitaleaceae bacterium]|nr:D-alanyl-D-alanine carboxypeptidase [Defluviitaleaceae bacterium]
MSVILLYLLVVQITSVYAQEVTEIRQMPSPPRYTAGAVVLIDADTGLILYGHEENTPMYPASITKVMTALVVLEHATDLSERIRFCDYAVWSIPRNSSHIYMDVGETLTIYEALYALMLESANEVSVALALHVAGSVENFADLMNRRAASLGAYDTNFVNPSGLAARNHTTTAYDMALIMREAVLNPIFRNIVSTVRFDIPPTERQADTRHLLNSNRQMRAGPFYNEYVIGGKTGFTPAAGNTLVTYAYHDGRRLITTVLAGEGTGAFNDTTELLNFGFELPMETVTIFDSSAYSIAIPVYQEINGTETEIGRVRLMSDIDLRFDLPPDWSHSWLRYDLSVPERLEPPVLRGTPFGRVAVYVQNIRVGEVPLTSRDAVFAYVPVTEETAYAYANLTPSYAAYYDQPEPDGIQIFSGRLEFLNNEYIVTLAIPLTISTLTLIFALVALATRRKRRLRRTLRSRPARFTKYPHYRYKYDK